jgi:hypothetical protein
MDSSSSIREARSLRKIRSKSWEVAANGFAGPSTSSPSRSSENSETGRVKDIPEC